MITQRLKDKLLASSDVAEVGRYTYGQPTFICFPSAAKARIGAFCSIADGVTFILGGEHDHQRVTTYPLNALFAPDGLPWHESTKGDLVVGNDVWIGYGATILSGVTIGDGAVVGAQSVVTRDVAPYSIMAGNPARTVRKRFDDATIEALLEMRWWEWDLEKIRLNAPKLLERARSETV